MEKETSILCKKIKLIPRGDKEEVNRVYKFIRDGQYMQNKAYNILISNVFAAIMSGNVDALKEIYKRGAI